MPEGGLSPAEVGKEIAEHSAHSSGHAKVHEERRDFILAVIEAVLLAVVAILAAWSGYSSAKWSTDSRLQLAQASAARTQASSATLGAITQRNFDASTFNAWFTAWVAGDPQKEQVAEHRFTPNFQRAFNAWMATDPLENPHAPPGPTYMAQYKRPLAVQARILNAKADRHYEKGAVDGTNSDDYVRITVYLATVLFLIAISGHFRIRSARIGLIVVGAVVLLFAVVNLASLPPPPA